MEEVGVIVQKISKLSYRTKLSHHIPFYTNNNTLALMTKHLSKETWDKIRDEILRGKSKYQTAAEFGLHPTVVYRRTQDLPGGQYGWPGIRGKTLEILQELIKHGYILCSHFNAGHKYRILRKYFPNICKINMRNKTILYLEDKASVAARAFLANLDRKIMSFSGVKTSNQSFFIGTKDFFLQ